MRIAFLQYLQPSKQQYKAEMLLAGILSSLAMFLFIGMEYNKPTTIGLVDGTWGKNGLNF